MLSLCNQPQRFHLPPFWYIGQVETVELDGPSETYKVRVLSEVLDSPGLSGKRNWKYPDLLAPTLDSSV